MGVLCDRAVMLNSLLPVISKISSELIVSVSFMEVATEIIRFIAFTVIRWHYRCFSIVVSYYSLVLAPAFGRLFDFFPFFLFPHQWFVLIFIFVPLGFFFLGWETIFSVSYVAIDLNFFTSKIFLDTKYRRIRLSFLMKQFLKRYITLCLIVWPL